MSKVLVRYVGLADWRVLTQDNLKKHGISLDRAEGNPKWLRDAVTVPVGPNDLVWSRNQALALDASDAMVELLKAQGHFQISELKDDGTEGKVVATASDPQYDGDIIVAGSERSAKPDSQRKEDRSK